MMVAMKHRLLALLSALTWVLSTPLAALAEDEELLDPRVEGFARNVKVTGGSVTLTWFVLILLAVICVAVLFKDAKRSHLD